MARGRAARWGAAPFAVGLYLAGPGLGLAYADAGNDDAGVSVSGDARGDSVRRGGREAREVGSGDRTPRATAARVPAPVAVARSSAAGPRPAEAEAQQTADPAADMRDTVQVAEPVVAVQVAGPIVAEPVDADPPDSLGAEVDIPIDVPVRGGGTLLPWWRGAEGGPGIDLPDPAAAASLSTPVQRNAVRHTEPVRRESSVPGPGITAAAAVNEFFTSSADWLAALPANPVADFLQAGLLLLRRTLFNQAPVVKPELVIAKVGAPAVGNVGALDVDGDQLTYVVSQAPAHGEVAIAADGSFVFTPEPGFRGEDSFTVSVADPGFHLNLVDLNRPLEVEAAVTVAVGLVLLGAGVPVENLYRDFVPIADCGCQDTWSFLGMVYRDGQCGNPEGDANGPWCRLNGTYNGANWSYCKRKDS